ncbi:MAG: hypothetical protein IJS67_02195 [Clostridia bacterium]|nr:hypothetical protein [Clostridia bacterium]
MEIYYRYAEKEKSHETLFEIARKKKAQLAIDKPENPLQPCFLYDSQTERLSAAFMIL